VLLHVSYAKVPFGGHSLVDGVLVIDGVIDGVLVGVVDGVGVADTGVYVVNALIL
jgi:hypothetical protein